VAALANPDELEAKARQLRSEATALEKALDALVRAARGAKWEGTAADQFHSDVGRDQKAVTAYANDLRSAASALDAGAAQVRRYLAEQKRLEQQQKQGHVATPTPR
jgi:uncharacterized protein YukE